MSTIVDVARRAGVSPMTVSRFLNKPEMLRPATRAVVERAIQELRFVPNEAARSLISGRTNTVALIVADITNPYFTTLARGVEDAAAALALTLILGNTDERLDKEDRYLHTLAARRVDGVILSPARGERHDFGELARWDIPIVLIDRRVPDAAADFLTSDSFDGGRQLTAHFLARGCRDVVFIGGPPGVTSLEDRAAGYRAVMQESGLTPTTHFGRYDRHSGEEIVDRLAAAGPMPRGIIAANNLVAVGAITALRRHGLRVPEDVALGCFGDIELAASIDPFLTVVAHPAYEIGRTAMQMLAERMTGFAGPPRERMLPVELIVRRSA